VIINLVLKTINILSENVLERYFGDQKVQLVVLGERERGGLPGAILKF